MVATSCWFESSPRHQSVGGPREIGGRRLFRVIGVASLMPWIRCPDPRVMALIDLRERLRSGPGLGIALLVIAVFLASFALLRMWAQFG